MFKPWTARWDPIKTAKTSFLGTLNMLGLAKRCRARFLISSTSEVYGDPLQHPQTEAYWGNVNPIGERSCYDEGEPGCVCAWPMHLHGVAGFASHQAAPHTSPLTLLAGKRIAETLTMDYNREHGTEVRIVRIFNTYGPRMALDDGRVVSNFVSQALTGACAPCAAITEFAAVTAVTAAVAAVLTVGARLLDGAVYLEVWVSLDLVLRWPGCQ